MKNTLTALGVLVGVVLIGVLAVHCVALDARVRQLEAGRPLERCWCGPDCPCKPRAPVNPLLPRRRDGALGDLSPERN
jgi:hypothetical protein